MNYNLSYSGQPGNLSATLTDENFKTIATETGLKNAKAVKRWAKGEAELHKQSLTAPEFNSEYVSVSGSGRFSL